MPERNCGFVYPKHVLDVEDGKAAHDAFLLNPVGTGPYKVESFSPNDQVIYVINENYREPNKPYFETGQPEGRRGRGVGGARRAADRGLRLRLEPAGRAADPGRAGAGRQGCACSIAPGTSVERIVIQFADSEHRGRRASGPS